jgi:hypothetical protein
MMALLRAQEQQARRMFLRHLRDGLLRLLE